MPRCNLNLKQKSQIIELSGQLSTEQLAKKFRVHPTTVTRTIKKKNRILDQASRVNVKFKTVQTNQRSEELDTLVLKFIKTKQAANERLSAREICNKAVELAKTLDRDLNRRAWFRRFKVRCNIFKTRLRPDKKSDDSPIEESSSPTETTTPSNTTKTVTNKGKGKSKAKARKHSKSNKKCYTYRIRESTGNSGLGAIKAGDDKLEQPVENKPTPSQ